MDNTSQYERDAALASWAASDDLHIDAADPQLLRGEDARAYGADILATVGRGRRPLDPTMRKGEHSPRRQVRLPKDLSAAVDDLAARQHRTPTDVMREAIQHYVTAAS